MRGATAVATEKQIAANRSNSKRSTGPKTVVGRSKSSRNAFRHGLSRPMTPDSSEVDSIALALAEADVRRVGTAKQLAQAQLELLRVRGIRRDLMASLDVERCGPEDLKRLIALDRYERIALTKRRKARLDL
jgi:hypothetical protein